MLILHLNLLLPRQKLIQPWLCVSGEYLEKTLVISWACLSYNVYRVILIYTPTSNQNPDMNKRF